MKFTKIALITVAALSAVGCANITVPAPQPSMANVNAAKQLPDSVKVGSFKLAAGLSPSVDQAISVRGSNTLSAPSGQSFSSYLRDVLVTELRAGNKLNEASAITITGELTKSELEAGMSVGTATLGARFLVTRANGVCLDKALTATAQWESSFMAAVAVPAAFNQYTALYPVLAGKLLGDADFKQRCMSKQ
ncbi:hypothetical protein [Aquabacterium sp.]|uniref:hypothetical protein n=1 Tax=Aquabacterium sp. TaxID=1872578 RepID=UPI0024887AEE|nr:hypothetical protein [Aquabacterium sp.]MDI1260496.1 hypothetical protein [Aquabacterium sp.]